MGTITGSCGHVLDPSWFEDGRANVITKSQARNGAPALSYATVCAECREDYRAQGLLLAGEAEASRWLKRASATLRRRYPAADQ